MGFFRRFKRNIKLTYQIWTRGWCDADTWSLDMTLGEIMVPRLKRFKELMNGYPGDLTWEQWNEIIDKIILAFELSAKQCDDTEEEVEKVNEGLQLFAKYYRDLWW